MEGAKGPRLRDFLSGSLATWVRVRWDSWERKRVSEQTEGWGFENVPPYSAYAVLGTESRAYVHIRQVFYRSSCVPNLPFPLALVSWRLKNIRRISLDPPNKLIPSINEKT